MSTPTSCFLALLVAPLAAAAPVAAQARTRSPIAGAQQEVPLAPLVVRLELRDHGAEVRVEHTRGMAPPVVLCDFRWGTGSPEGDLRVACGEVAAGWQLRVLRRMGSTVTPCANLAIRTPTVKAGVPVLLTVVRDPSSPPPLNALACRFAP